ncbi:hypothetical protein MRX96_003215 [Rhipicephalus microplus]
MAFKLSLFMQILLSWSATLPLNLVNTEACPFRLVPQPTRPVFESINADTRKNLWPFPPILDSPRYLVWQPQATINAADLSARLQKPSSIRSQLGHATAASMAFKLSFFMQDSICGTVYEPKQGKDIASARVSPADRFVTTVIGVLRLPSTGQVPAYKQASLAPSHNWQQRLRSQTSR